MDMDVNLFRYTLNRTINENTDVIAASSDLDIITNYYEAEVNKCCNSSIHTIIYVYDYDKNANIKYFDNQDGTY